MKEAGKEEEEEAVVARAEMEERDEELFQGALQKSENRMRHLKPIEQFSAAAKPVTRLLLLLLLLLLQYYYYYYYYCYYYYYHSPPILGILPLPAPLGGLMPPLGGLYGIISPPPPDRGHFGLTCAGGG